MADDSHDATMARLLCCARRSHVVFSLRVCDASVLAACDDVCGSSADGDVRSSSNSDDDCAAQSLTRQRRRQGLCVTCAAACADALTPRQLLRVLRTATALTSQSSHDVVRAAVASASSAATLLSFTALPRRWRALVQFCTAVTRAVSHACAAQPHDTALTRALHDLLYLVCTLASQTHAHNATATAATATTAATTTRTAHLATGVSAVPRQRADAHAAPALLGAATPSPPLTVPMFCGDAHDGDDDVMYTTTASDDVVAVGTNSRDDTHTSCAQCGRLPLALVQLTRALLVDVLACTLRRGERDVAVVVLVQLSDLAARSRPFVHAALSQTPRLVRLLRVCVLPLCCSHLVELFLFVLHQIYAAGRDCSTALDMLASATMTADSDEDDDDEEDGTGSHNGDSMCRRAAVSHASRGCVVRALLCGVCAAVEVHATNTAVLSNALALLDVVLVSSQTLRECVFAATATTALHHDAQPAVRTAAAPSTSSLRGLPSPHTTATTQAQRQVQQEEQQQQQQQLQPLQAEEEYDALALAERLLRLLAPTMLHTREDVRVVACDVVCCVVQLPLWTPCGDVQGDVVSADEQPVVAAAAARVRRTRRVMWSLLRDYAIEALQHTTPAAAVALVTLLDALHATTAQSSARCVTCCRRAAQQQQSQQQSPPHTRHGDDDAHCTTAAAHYAHVDNSDGDDTCSSSSSSDSDEDDDGVAAALLDTSAVRLLHALLDLATSASEAFAYAVRGASFAYALRGCTRAMDDAVSLLVRVAEQQQERRRQQQQQQQSCSSSFAHTATAAMTLECVLWQLYTLATVAAAAVTAPTAGEDNDDSGGDDEEGMRFLRAVVTMWRQWLRVDTQTRMAHLLCVCVQECIAEAEAHDRCTTRDATTTSTAVAATAATMSPPLCSAPCAAARRQSQGQQGRGQRREQVQSPLTQHPPRRRGSCNGETMWAHDGDVHGTSTCIALAAADVTAAVQPSRCMTAHTLHMLCCVSAPLAQLTDGLMTNVCTWLLTDMHAIVACVAALPLQRWQQLQQLQAPSLRRQCSSTAVTSTTTRPLTRTLAAVVHMTATVLLLWQHQYQQQRQQHRDTCTAAAATAATTTATSAKNDGAHSAGDGADGDGDVQTTALPPAACAVTSLVSLGLHNAVLLLCATHATPPQAVTLQRYLVRSVVAAAAAASFASAMANNIDSDDDDVCVSCGDACVLATRTTTSATHVYTACNVACARRVAAPAAAAGAAVTVAQSWGDVVSLWCTSSAHRGRLLYAVAVLGNVAASAAHPRTTAAAAFTMKSTRAARAKACVPRDAAVLCAGVEDNTVVSLLCAAIDELLDALAVAALHDDRAACCAACLVDTHTAAQPGRVCALRAVRRRVRVVVELVVVVVALPAHGHCCNSSSSSNGCGGGGALLARTATVASAATEKDDGVHDSGGVVVAAARGCAGDDSDAHDASCVSRDSRRCARVLITHSALRRAVCGVLVSRCGHAAVDCRAVLRRLLLLPHPSSRDVAVHLIAALLIEQHAPRPLCLFAAPQQQQQQQQHDDDNDDDDDDTAEREVVKPCACVSLLRLLDASDASRTAATMPRATASARGALFEAVLQLAQSHMTRSAVAHAAAAHAVHVTAATQQQQQQQQQDDTVAVAALLRGVAHWCVCVHDADEEDEGGDDDSAMATPVAPSSPTGVAFDACVAVVLRGHLCAMALLLQQQQQQQHHPHRQACSATLAAAVANVAVLALLGGACAGQASTVVAHDRRMGGAVCRECDADSAAASANVRLHAVLLSWTLHCLMRLPPHAVPMHIMQLLYVLLYTDDGAVSAAVARHHHTLCVLVDAVQQAAVARLSCVTPLLPPPSAALKRARQDCDEADDVRRAALRDAPMLVTLVLYSALTHAHLRARRGGGGGAMAASVCHAHLPVAWLFDILHAHTRTATTRRPSSSSSSPSCVSRWASGTVASRVRLLLLRVLDEQLARTALASRACDDADAEGTAARGQCCRPLRSEAACMTAGRTMQVALELLLTCPYARMRDCAARVLYGVVHRHRATVACLPAALCLRALCQQQAAAQWLRPRAAHPMAHSSSSSSSYAPAATQGTSADVTLALRDVVAAAPDCDDRRSGGVGVSEATAAAEAAALLRRQRLSQHDVTVRVPPVCVTAVEGGWLMAALLCVAPLAPWGAATASQTDAVVRAFLCSAELSAYGGCVYCAREAHAMYDALNAACDGWAAYAHGSALPRARVADAVRRHRASTCPHVRAETTATLASLADATTTTTTTHTTADVELSAVCCVSRQPLLCHCRRVPSLS